MNKSEMKSFIQHHLHTIIRDATLDTSFFGIQFLPVEKKLYLKLQSILRRLELRFSSLKETLFLYKDQLIWSGLSQDDTSLVYSFFRLYYWPHIKTLLNSSIAQTDITVRTIYYNKINMAHSSTIDWTREPNNSMAGVMNTLAEDMQWFHPSGEIMVKRENDPWIISKRSDMRELLIVVNQKNANLKEISGKNIFIIHNNNKKFFTFR
ncbi:unnamed protein product [Rotaria sp. Silwood1]|nr:unnamed protein product [Rotaria sp. Silwood1]